MHKHDNDLGRNRQNFRHWLKQKRLTPLLLHSHQNVIELSIMSYKSILWMRDFQKIREQFRCPATYYVRCGAAHLWAKGRKKSNDCAQKTSEFHLKQNVIWRSMIDCCSNNVINKQSVLISLHFDPKFLLFKDRPSFPLRQRILWE